MQCLCNVFTVNNTGMDVIGGMIHCSADLVPKRSEAQYEGHYRSFPPDNQTKHYSLYYAYNSSSAFLFLSFG